MSQAGKLKLLFLCTGNSCRSQMAEGFANAIKGDCVEAYSAGIETHGLNPSAVKVMAEAGVDITSQRSQHVDEFADVKFDYVVTVCSRANENCPVFAGDAKVLHVGFDDPPKLAAQALKLAAAAPMPATDAPDESAADGESAVDEEAALDIYRRVRDEIRAYVQSLPDALTDTTNH